MENQEKIMQKPNNGESRQLEQERGSFSVPCLGNKKLIVCTAVALKLYDSRSKFSAASTAKDGNVRAADQEMDTQRTN